MANFLSCISSRQKLNPSEQIAKLIKHWFIDLEVIVKTSNSRFLANIHLIHSDKHIEMKGFSNGFSQLMHQ